MRCHLSVTTAVNPGGFFPFVCWIYYYYFLYIFKLRILHVVSSFVVLSVRLAVAPGGCVVVFLVLMLSTDLIKIFLLSWAC